MSEQADPEIRVNDRRRFNSEGESKPEAEPTPEAPGPVAEPPADQSAGSSAEPPPGFMPPPASLEMLVLSLAMQAQMELGAGGDPSQPPNLPLAQHSIDLLAVLQEKTQGNLSLEEKRLLENSLTELRFRYVQKVQEINEQSKGGADADSAS